MLHCKLWWSLFLYSRPSHLACSCVVPLWQVCVFIMSALLYIIIYR
jgi:hypothetical protein